MDYRLLYYIAVAKQLSNPHPPTGLLGHLNYGRLQ